MAQQGNNPGVDHVQEEDQKFSFSEVDLELPDEGTLGDERTARKGEGIGDLDFGTASVDGVFTGVDYGTFEGAPACRVMLSLTIKSPARFRIREAHLTCTVGSPDSNHLGASTGDILRPKMLRAIPKRLSELNPTVQGIEASWTLAPAVTLPIGLSITLGSITRKKTYERTSGWNVQSSITSKDPDFTNRDRARWSASSNEAQANAYLQEINVEMLFAHAGKPFYADFQLEAKMDFAGTLRWIGRRKKVERRRHFAPYDTPVVFT